jgi:cobalt/nickel transport system permease protein/cobalt/nickel transport protein
MKKNISTVKKMWLGLAVLALASPMGIILPDQLKAGSAWGEWSPEEMEKRLGYIPLGMKELAELWHAPMPDYTFKGWNTVGLGIQSLGYLLSALIGITVIAALVLLLGKIGLKE